MQILERFDTRIVSMFLSISLLLLIGVVMQKVYLPKRKPLTLDDVRIIEEIRKITRSSPQAVEKPSTSAKKTVRPQKRHVRELIQTRLSELRKKQMLDKKDRKKTIERTIPKIGVKKPVIGMTEKRKVLKKKITLDGLVDKIKNRKMVTTGPVITVAKASDSDQHGEIGGSIRDEIDTGMGSGPGSGGESGENIPSVTISPGTSFGSDGGEGISDILQPLIEWMKRNPAEFSPVEKKFLEFGAGDLTSRAHFNLEHKTFDLLLLFKRVNTELRICMREGTDVILLIDQGLQERSNYLREGKATPDSEGRVVAFGTTQKSASEEETHYFYQVFMSWWNWVQKN